MGFYNPLIPIINIIKKFLYFISKKIFILLLIIIFLAFFILLAYTTTSKAVSLIGEEEDFGYSTAFDNNQISIINDIIENYSDNYDSFFSRFWQSSGTSPKILVYFYNEDVTGKIYFNGSQVWEDFYAYRFYTENQVNNSVLLVQYDVNSATFDTTGLLVNGFNDLFRSRLSDNIPFLYTNRNIYDTNNNLWFESSNINIPHIIEPYIDNSTSSIENWSFDNLIIKGNVDIRHNNEFYKTLILKLIINDYTFSQFIDTSYISYTNDNISNGNDWTITIPKNQLFNDLFNSESNLLDRNFILNVVDNSENENINYDLGTYDITLTQQQLNDINGQNNFNQQQQLQEDITNPNISSDFSNSSGGGFRDFSDGMDIQDNTSINSMFSMIYNAFTTQYGWNGSGETPYELELTLPISNQTIKISPYSIYGRNWYTDTDNTAITIIKTLLNMFWWYVIGSFVIKDIRNTINKVAEGNIENASSDIKKELL